VLPQRLWAAGSGQETLPGTSSITMLGARPYQPYLGVFLAPDPIVDSGTNLYSYTNGDPINSQDSSGRMSEEAVGGIIAGSGVLATLLGGLVGNRFGQLTGIRKLLEAESPQILAQTNKLSNSARLGFDVGTAIWNTAGIAATGYGTYLAVKASTDSQGGAIAAAVGASILTAYASWALHLGSNGPYFLKMKAMSAARRGSSGTPKANAAQLYLFPPVLFYKAAKKTAQSAAKARGVDRASLGSVADMFEGLGAGKSVTLPDVAVPHISDLANAPLVQNLAAKASMQSEVVDIKSLASSSHSSMSEGHATWLAWQKHLKAGD
jgi:RHS repeat-associated protein